MPKHILLFGAGKSASALIDYLLEVCKSYEWHFTVVDNNLPMIKVKLGDIPYATALELYVENSEQRVNSIRESDIVISLLPPSLHILVAADCLRLGKHLLTASYIDDEMLAMMPAIKDSGLIFLCEMGLDPGIDHMSAMQLVHRIQARGGKVTSFRSHCGGLVAPESDDNPWHYKISWNPRNVVNAGNSGATFKENNRLHKPTYEELFNCNMVMIKGLGELAYYPNRDALRYMQVYGLENTATFVRTTLRHIQFCRAWKSLVLAGLTNNLVPIDTCGLTFNGWSKSIQPFLDENNRQQLAFLGLFEDILVPQYAKTSADILQYLLETRLAMQPHDKDMVVMMHEIEYQLEGRKMKMESTLVMTGQDSTRTAMAKTVGLPLGIAASLILQEKIRLTGLMIPTVPEIYQPVMNQLKEHGIKFKETESFV